MSEQAVRLFKEEMALRQAGQERLKLGISAEGGGTGGGVVVAGMAAALLDMGVLPRHFKVIKGRSSGTLNMAWYAAEASHIGASIYYEDALQPDFFDWRRLAGKAPVMNLDHLLDLTMVREKPLDYKAVVAGRNLRPIAIDVETGKSDIFEPAHSVEELKLQIKASANMPKIGGPPVRVYGREKMDGALLDDDLEIARQLDVDLWLMLRSRPLEAKSSASLKSRLEIRLTEAILERELAKIRPGLGQLAVGYHRRGEAQQARLRDLSDEHPHILVIAPAAGTEVGRFDRNPKRIINGAIAGYIAAKKTLGAETTGNFRTAGAFIEV